MRRIVFKTFGIFVLAILIISMTGAAAASIPCKANHDTFELSRSNPVVGNVLSNDQGSKLKVMSISKTINGGKAIVYSRGDFYYKPASCSMTTTYDSFTYTIADEYGHKSTSKVTVNYKKAQEGIGTGSGSVLEITQLEQINTALHKGPVFLRIGAEWCESCQQLNPIIDQLATEYQGKATFMSIDVDKSPILIEYFDSYVFPDSFIIVGIDNGVYVYRHEDGSVTKDRSQARIIGLQDKEEFEKLLNSATSG